MSQTGNSKTEPVAPESNTEGSQDVDSAITVDQSPTGTSARQKPTGPRTEPDSDTQRFSVINENEEPGRSAAPPTRPTLWSLLLRLFRRRTRQQLGTKPSGPADPRGPE